MGKHRRVACFHAIVELGKVQMVRGWFFSVGGEQVAVICFGLSDEPRNSTPTSHKG
jgi:hypothetical protein